MSLALHRVVSPLAALAAACVATAIAACDPSPMASGSWGSFRFVGMVPGPAPLALIPPVSDRNGDVYTMYGAIGLPEVQIFVSNGGGESYATCALTKGDAYGAHGWSGVGQDRAWYWSGYALVTVFGANQPCVRVLDVDPATNVNLQFRGVLPWVKVGLQHTTVVVLLQSDVDAVPFAAVVDLTDGIATNVAQFQPSDATDVRVAGVGADPGGGSGFALVTYTRGSTTKTVGLFYDDGANLVATVPIAGSPLDAYSIAGYLVPAGGGTVVGLTTSGDLVVFDRSSGAVVKNSSTIDLVGVHFYNSATYVVGTQNGKPVIAPIDSSGNIGAAQEWTSSEQAAANVAGGVQVSDERTLPARPTTWSTATTAMGPFPFLAAFSPWPQAPSTTLWAIAGPTTMNTSSQPLTDIAIAPVGITYP